MIPFLSIKETFESERCHRIEFQINFRQWVTVFWVCFVQVLKIDAHLPCSVAFRNNDWICNLCLIPNFSNNPSAQEILNLFIHGLRLLRTHFPFLLDDWSKRWIDLQLVFRNLSWNTRYIRWLPVELVHIACQQLLQKRPHYLKNSEINCSFLFWKFRL